MEENAKSKEVDLLELSMTIFYLARYAECLEIDKAISVEDERELFYLILDWARDFELRYDGKLDYQAQLEDEGYHWLLSTFPYDPDLDEDLCWEAVRQEPMEKPGGSDGMTLH
mgnify:CR=1 FL=1